MLEPSLHINTPGPIPPGALAMLPEDFSPAEAQPQIEPSPDATGDALDRLFAEAVAFVNLARKTVPQLPGEDTLHSGERSILRILEEAGPCTVPQIARARTTSRQNVQIIINRLSGEGRVELVSNPSHRRSKLVVLTAKGKHWLEAFNKNASVALPAKVKIPAAEIQAAGRVLLRLRRALAEGADGTGMAAEAAPTEAEENRAREPINEA